jgi:hypothetical protein
MLGKHGSMTFAIVRIDLGESNVKQSNGCVDIAIVTI